MEPHDFDPNQGTQGSTPPMISAVVNNNVGQLMDLISEGQSINVRDNKGNTPLHLAVLHNRDNIFNVLITLDEIALDAEDSDGYSPLLLAMYHFHSHYAQKLIEKGADVNCADSFGQGLFHFIARDTLKLVPLLIERGALINGRDCEGETPLLKASRNIMQLELAHMFLYYGADPTICDIDGLSPLAFAIAYWPDDMKEIMFNHTFDEQGEKYEVNLGLFIYALGYHSSLFYRILERTSRVIYDNDQLASLARNAPICNLQMLQTLLQGFDYLARNLFQRKYFFSCDHFDTLTIWGAFIDFPVIADFLYMVFTDPLLVDLAVQNFDPKIEIIQVLGDNWPLDILSGLVCCMMSYGVKFTANDLNHLYFYHNNCELFRIMTHVELKYTRFEFNYLFLMPIIIQDVRRECFDFEEFLGGSHRTFVDRESLLKFLRFFAFPRFKQYCLEHHRDDHELLEMAILRPVPSMVELSRNVARKYIIEKYNVQSCAEFNSVLNKLQIGKVYTRILTFEKELYSY